MKKAIIAACAGTADVRAAEEAIRPVERALEEAFPDWTVRRAFTSRRIAAAAGTETEAEALARLKDEGYGRIVAASMHLLPGSEYAYIPEMGLPATRPLLDGGGAEIAALLSRISMEEGRAVLAVGHPSERAAETWARLEEALGENAFLARLDEEPAAVAARLPGGPLTVLPLMLTAGRHARRDVEGKWLPALRAMGFDARARLEGLGSRREIREMIVDRVQMIIGGNENG